MSAQCAKPACQQPVAGWFLTIRDDQRVAIVAEPDPHGIGLCDQHLGRFTVPAGWTLDDRRADAHHERRPWFAPDDLDLEAETESDEQHPVPGSLLARAFEGPVPVQSGRLPWLERVDHEVDGAPQRLGDGEEQQREEYGERETHEQDRADAQIRSHDRDHDEQRNHDHGEGDDGVDTYGTDELPSPPLEPEFAARAAFG